MSRNKYKQPLGEVKKITNIIFTFDFSPAKLARTYGVAKLGKPWTHNDIDHYLRTIETMEREYARN